jgi:PBP1b-binding outer membrane lipoprotein LpoB
MRKIVLALAIAALVAAGCHSQPKEAPKVTETSTAPPVTQTHIPTDTSTSTVTAPKPTETQTNVEVPTTTVTAPGTTVTETKTP